MIENAHLPPVYRLVPLDAAKDILSTAREEAVGGRDAATLFCAERNDYLDCAVVLEPSMPLAEARLVVYVAMLGLGDALGSVVPPGIDVTFRWPNVIEANLAPVARVDLAAPAEIDEKTVPQWLILHALTAISIVDDNTSNFETTLVDEGAADVTSVVLLESFARHFLTWMNRWEDDGFAAVRAMWLRHAPGHGEEIQVTFGGLSRKGIFKDIDNEGAMILDGSQRSCPITLSSVIGT